MVVCWSDGTTSFSPPSASCKRGRPANRNDGQLVFLLHLSSYQLTVRLFLLACIGNVVSLTSAFPCSHRWASPTTANKRSEARDTIKKANSLISGTALGGAFREEILRRMTPQKMQVPFLVTWDSEIDVFKSTVGWAVTCVVITTHPTTT